jgi:Na+/proline symporter
MRTLAPLDLAIIVFYLVLIFIAGLALTRRAGKSVESFFVGGRDLPWWLLGISMAATNFSIDTPIAITRLVLTEGISGVWFFWASAISALLVTFLFARLWRRSGVVTDAEIVELRYGGKAGAALRLFKGFYFGVVFNAFIMGWVFLALTKVMSGLTNLDIGTLLFITTVLVFVYSLASGFYGVVLTDFVQYFVALGGSVILAFFAVRAVGGLGSLATGLAEKAPGMTRFTPEFSVAELGPLSVFFTYVMVQWWAHKYADGGGKHIQRMLSARDESHAFRASLLYAFLNYGLQVWPWILTALSSLLLFGQLDDPETAYARTMAEVLPTGLLGLVVAGLLGAFMSTIDTHLNLGASYMVNDIYRRFLHPNGSERHYVMVSRLAMVLLLGLSVVLALNMTSVAGAWKFLLTFASGAGVTWIIRWFWWRMNAWSEFSAMITSGVVASYLELWHSDWLYSQKLLTTVGLTALVWIPVTLLTPVVEASVLRDFVRRIRPGSWGWGKVSDGGTKIGGEYLRQALGSWALALVGLFGLSFGLGSLLLVEVEKGLGLIALGGVALFLLGRRQLSEEG